jgi:hypothetical protein
MGRPPKRIRAILDSIFLPRANNRVSRRIYCYGFLVSRKRLVISHIQARLAHCPNVAETDKVQRMVGIAFEGQLKDGASRKAKEGQ